LYARHYVSLPPELEAAVNRLMAASGMTRSRIVADALRAHRQVRVYLEEAGT
jgi:metal-responsive CopG/Arc/MetJ family transcriptional regulator